MSTDETEHLVVNAVKGAYPSEGRSQPHGTNPSRWLGITFLLLGVGYLVKAATYPIGTLANAGPGLFPVIVGIIWVIGAAGMVFRVEAMRVGNKTVEISENAVVEKIKLLGRHEYGKLAISAALLVGTVFVLFRLGFVVTTAMLSAGVMLLVGERRWYVIALTSLGLAMGAFLLFRLILQIQLPVGLL